jgi:hypothetical protein
MLAKLMVHNLGCTKFVLLIYVSVPDTHLRLRVCIYTGERESAGGQGARVAAPGLPPHPPPPSLRTGLSPPLLSLSSNRPPSLPSSPSHLLSLPLHYLSLSLLSLSPVTLPLAPLAPPGRGPLEGYKRAGSQFACLVEVQAFAFMLACKQMPQLAPAP